MKGITKMDTTTNNYTNAEVAFFDLLNKADKRSVNSGNKLRSALLQTMYSFESDYFGSALLDQISNKDGIKASVARKRLGKKFKENVIEAIITLAQEKKDDKDYLKRVEDSLFTSVSIALKYPGITAK
jgi:hypothetical protein